ncbi:hypothetical protein NDU88_007807 [Pleurodeles waltl]|uniref:Uncharacterized protein n=1 Tax=Pleurodeles waltl TaxID=8319 RepID=A0AAV7NUC8_PLEWA|nr:hypothetical protein NDU88_007807 [Pleurodeles waltl]
MRRGAVSGRAHEDPWPAGPRDRLFICSDGIGFVLVMLKALHGMSDRVLGIRHCARSITLKGGMGSMRAR